MIYLCTIRYYQFPENRVQTPDVASSPSVKRFLIKRKIGKQMSLESCITIDKRFLSSIFEKLSKKYHIEKDVKHILLYYPLQETNGKLPEICIANDEDAEESIESFYSLTPEMASLTIEVCKDQKKGK